jgi:chromosome segregation ATPase
VRMGASSGANPFNKIKGLIEDMIAKLEKEMGEEADEKAYCDEEMTKTEAKKGELEADVEKMTSKIDKAAASSAALKEEVKELEAELATLAREQSDMDKIRSETNADYKVAKADLELGLSGVKKALTVLRDYYSSAASAALMQEGKFGAFMQQPAMPEKHTKSAGAGGSIIGILEVCESDFASNLAKEETEEADAQDEYEKTTQSNKVSKTMKDADVKYKTKEAAGLDKSIAEISGDRETTNAELSAVLEYYSKIKERCIAKPESYEERKTRRAAEIDGLKEALSILEDETAFVQRKKRGGLRGAIAL